MKIQHPLFVSSDGSVITLGGEGAAAIEAPGQSSQAPSLQMNDVPKEAVAPAEIKKEAPVVESAKEDPSVVKPVMDLESFLAKFGPKDLKEDDPRFSQWKDVKGMVGRAVEDNIRVSTEIAGLNTQLANLSKELEETRAKITDSKDNGERPKAADLQEYKDLEAKFKAAAADLEKYQAKDNLASNPAFKHKYDGSLAVIAAEAMEVAQAAGVSKETLDAIFSGKNEYEVMKALNDADISDDVAAKLIREKAVAFSKIQKERDSILNGTTRSVAEHAAEWEKYNADFGLTMSKRFTDALQGNLIGALPKVTEELSAESEYFKGPGRFILEGLHSRFSQGVNVPYEEVVKALAYSQVAPVWEKTAVEQQAKIKELQGTIARMSGMSPSQITKDGSDAPAASVKGSTTGLTEKRSDTTIDLRGGQSLRV